MESRFIFVQAAFYFVVLLSSSSGEQDFPVSPCPDVLKFAKDDNGRIYGIIEGLKNDCSGKYTLDVVLSTGRTDLGQHEILIKNLTTRNETKYGKDLNYKLEFKQDLLPKITKIALNGILYCQGPPESANGVTSYTVNNTLNVSPVKCERKYIQASLLRTVRTTNPQNNASSCHCPPTSCQSIEPPTSNSAIVQSFGNIGDDLLDGFPWLVAILLRSMGNYEHRCTGSLISPSHVLSMASCFNYKDDKNKFYLILGKQDVYDWSMGSIVRRVRSLFISEGHNPGRREEGKTALILMDKPIEEFGSKVIPIDLPKPGEPIDLKRAMLAGWKTSDIKPSTNSIEVTGVDITEDCENSYVRMMLSNKTFCATDIKNNDFCSMDDGAALVILGNKKWTLRGLTFHSWDKKCIQFVDVSIYAKWIQDMMKIN